jgi:Zn-dependent M28 family amino/carboxypeptidase
MEVAEAFAQADQAGFSPKRSLLFIAFTGEEKGLLGSDFYVRNPAFSLDETVVNLNIDMVGRSEPIDSGYVYLIGSDKISLELHEISESINENHTKLILDYTYNREEDINRFYYRSDQYNFARHGIPVIFYFTGTHEDYHKPSDTIEKLQFENMARISELIFYTAWEIANREKRLELNK